MRFETFYEPDVSPHSDAEFITQTKIYLQNQNTLPNLALQHKKNVFRLILHILYLLCPLISEKNNCILMDPNDSLWFKSSLFCEIILCVCLRLSAGPSPCLRFQTEQTESLGLTHTYYYILNRQPTSTHCVAQRTQYSAIT